MTLGVFDPELRENVHPEQLKNEVFIGNFDRSFAQNRLPYQKKRLGTVSYMDDGTAYPTTMGRNRPIPVFVDRTEFLERRNKTYFG